MGDAPSLCEAAAAGALSTLQQVQYNLTAICCRERRIQERRRRIQERLQALRQGGSSHTAKGEPQDVPVGPGVQQMLESTRRIMALKAETSAMVNSYPLEADVAENWRRNAEAKRKHGLRSRMLEEAEESAKKNAVVAMHWADLFAIDVPQVCTFAPFQLTPLQQQQRRPTGGARKE
jgi:hypothetical protein